MIKQMVSTMSVKEYELKANHNMLKMCKNNKP